MNTFDLASIFPFETATALCMNYDKTSVHNFVALSNPVDCVNNKVALSSLAYWLTTWDNLRKGEGLPHTTAELILGRGNDLNFAWQAQTHHCHCSKRQILISASGMPVPTSNNRIATRKFVSEDSKLWIIDYKFKAMLTLTELKVSSTFKFRNVMVLDNYVLI